MPTEDAHRSSIGQLRTRENCDRQRRMAFETVRHRHRVAARSWVHVDVRLKDWKALCKKTYAAMMVCAFCAAVMLGGDPKWVPRTHVSEHRPTDIANPMLSQFTEHNGFVVCCPSCSTNGLRSQYNVMFTPSYMYDVLWPTPQAMQLLSLLDTGMQFQERSKGFVHGTQERRTLELECTA